MKTSHKNFMIKLNDEKILSTRALSGEEIMIGEELHTTGKVDKYSTKTDSFYVLKNIDLCPGKLAESKAYCFRRD